MRHAQVELWLEALHPTWKGRAQCLPQLLLDAAPGIHEEWKFGDTPFWCLNRWMCCMAMQNDRLILAFVHGRRLADPEGMCAATGHNLVPHCHVPPPGVHMDEDALRRLIHEAVLFDLHGARDRKPRKGDRRNPFSA
jgi:hypothetical protein